MTVGADVRQAFSEFRIGAPCTPSDIAGAERKLGHALPPLLAELYSELNGFIGPTHAEFFYTLSSLVEMTLFFRSEDYFPKFLHNAVVFGDDGTGPVWLIVLDQPSQIVRWDPEWGEDTEPLPGRPLDVWLKAKAVYESL